LFEKKRRRRRMFAWRSILAMLFVGLGLAMMIAYPLKDFWRVTYVIDSTQGMSSFKIGTTAQMVYSVDRVKYSSEFGQDSKKFDTPYLHTDPAYKLMQGLDGLMGFVFPFLAVMLCMLVVSVFGLTTKVPKIVARHFRKIFLSISVLTFALLMASMFTLTLGFAKATQGGSLTGKSFPADIGFPEFSCDSKTVTIQGKLFNQLGTDTLDRCARPSVNARYLVTETDGIATVWVYQNVAPGFWMCFFALMAVSSVLLVIWSDATFDTMFPVDVAEKSTVPVFLDIEAA